MRNGTVNANQSLALPTSKPLVASNRERTSCDNNTPCASTGGTSGERINTGQDSVWLRIRNRNLISCVFNRLHCVFSYMGVLRPLSNHSLTHCQVNQNNRPALEGRSYFHSPASLSSNSEIPYESKTRADGNQHGEHRDDNSRPIQGTIGRTMPVAAIQPKNKISPGYLCPKSGKVRVYLEASQPVDVYVASNQQADGVDSPATAANLGVLTFLGQTKLDQTVTLPLAWQFGGGWKLVIGNGQANVVAVYYMVYDL